MSVKNIGKGKWKIVVTQRKAPKKRECIFEGTKLQADQKELEMKLQMKADAEKEEAESVRSLTFKTIGDCLRYFDEEKRSWGDSVYNRLMENFDHVLLSESWEKLSTFVKMMKSSTTQLGKPFSNATINRHIAMLKGAFSNAYKHRKISENYLTGFSTLKENNKKYRILVDDERRRLYSELADHLKPLFYYACRVPCRIGELVNLTKDQYNPASKLIDLTGVETKNGEGRWLPVFPEMLEYFNSIPKECPYLFYRKDSEGTYHPLGYWDSVNGRVRANIKTAWYSACKRANITDYNFHKTRQQAAMQLLYEGYSEMEVMRIGGWKTYDAFHRYVQADDMMLKKRMGLWQLDVSWYEELRPRPVTG